MKQLLFILSITLTIVACKKEITQNEGDIAYLGGEIINPKNKTVVVSRSNKILDTLTLDKNNRFLYKIINLESGLYKFELQAHYGVEFQLALLEPNDSIMFRLNTMDFDESLVYTGKGAKKNNYLINMFLESEIEDKQVLGFSQLAPLDFEKQLDSLKLVKLNKLQLFNSKYEASPLFNKIALANVDYNYYLSKEVYPFAYYGDYDIKRITSLPDNFYNYRKDIDYNSDVLKDYFPYYSFLKYHFNNLALTEYFKHSKDSVFNRNSLNYNLGKLKLIDSLIENNSIKNPLLIMPTLNFISQSKNLKEFDTILNFFNENSTDAHDKSYVNKLAKSLKNLKPGNPVPDILLLNSKNETVNLASIIKKPTVLYFWANNYKSHFKETHNKVLKLEQKYPEVDFIAINLEELNLRESINTLRRSNYAITNEYLFKNPKEAKQTLAINPITKVMIINSDGTIAEGQTNLFSIYFEKQLLSVLNK